MKRTSIWSTLRETADRMSLLLGGCATTIRSRRHHLQPVAGPAARQELCRSTQPAPQDNTLELQSYENLVRGQLDRLGFHEAQGVAGAEGGDALHDRSTCRPRCSTRLSLRSIRTARASATSAAAAATGAAGTARSTIRSGARCRLRRRDRAPLPPPAAGRDQLGRRRQAPVRRDGAQRQHARCRPRP